MSVKRRLSLLVGLAAAAVASAAVATAAPELTVKITAGPPDPSTSNIAPFEFKVSEDDASLACTLDGSALEPCLSPLLVVGLPDGRHTFVVTARDASGTTASDSYSWSIDVIALAGPPQFSGRDVAFSFAPTTPTSPTANFECALDAAPFSKCQSPQTYTGLAEGPHAFRVRAVAGGREVGFDRYSWAVDATAPTVAIRTGPPAQTPETVARFELEVDDAGATVECSLDDGAFAACASPYTTPQLSAGGHTFRVRATDAAKNVTTISYTWTVTPGVDTTPPARAAALDSFVAYRYAELMWVRPADADFDHVTVYRVDGGRRIAVYSGTASRYKARGFNNGVDHRYQVVSYDHARNASRAARISISASALLGTPRRGARVRRPPALRWTPVAAARFYNVQLFRNGRKIMSTWPRRPRVQLGARWRYAGRVYSFDRGTYEWWIWPAFGRGKATRYGSALGHSTFVYR